MQNTYQKNQGDQFLAFKIKLNDLLRNPNLCGKKAIELAKFDSHRQKALEKSQEDNSQLLSELKSPNFSSV